CLADLRPERVVGALAKDWALNARGAHRSAPCGGVFTSSRRAPTIGLRGRDISRGYGSTSPGRRVCRSLSRVEDSSTASEEHDGSTSAAAAQERGGAAQDADGAPTSEPAGPGRGAGAFDGVSGFMGL